MGVEVDSGCHLSVFERIDARIRGDERRHGLGEAGFGDLLRGSSGSSPREAAPKSTNPPS